MDVLAWIVLGLPFFGFLILLAPPKEPSRKFTRALAVTPIATGFILTATIFGVYLSRPDDERLEVSSLWEWIDIGGLPVDLAIQVDTLTIYMMLVITGIGSMIMLFATDYMELDRDYRRFFAEMNFFVFSMLLLVMAGNFFFLIVGWGLVGLASYLLIGYYYEKPSAVAASKKAFVINVIGDVGMILAAFLIIRELGTLDYGEVFARADSELGQGTGTSEAIAFLLLVGVAAKSAQFPLHTWLPDAMEGPTPVSALIHAATMVTAGVYLIVRCQVLYQNAPIASDTIAVIGGITLFFAATIAFMQEDIKRVLAWSTVSQIGYMIMGAGLGLYGAAMFHLLMHAFFKALLFLSAGAVIHALAGEQSLNKMGGLRRHLGWPTLGFLVGAFALGGIAPFSGFFSKDEILEQATELGTLGISLAVVGTIGSVMTAFYAFRAYFRAFEGPDREGGYGHLHRTNWRMVVPIAVLSVGATFAGWLQVPNGWHLIDDWLESAFLAAPDVKASVTSEVIISLCTFVFGLAAIGLAWWMFGRGPQWRLRHADVLPGVRRVVDDQYMLNEVYDEVFVQSGKDLGDAMVRDVEPGGVFRSIKTTVAVFVAAATGLRWAQSGLVRSYVFVFVVGVAVISAVVILASQL